MGIKKTPADRKEKEFCELPKVTNSDSDTKTTTNRRPRKGGRRQRKMVQKLFDTCKEVFARGGPGIVPPPDKIEKLRAVLDDIQLTDVGLSPEMPFFDTQATSQVPTITYQHLHECDKFSIGIFCLPPSGVIPLHNHPGMTVFSKLLFGTMHIKSYDWVDVHCSSSTALNPSQSNTVQHPEVRLAKLKVNSNHTSPCNAAILYPADGGNMHCFTAVTACAVLDVLGPPYSDPDGRHCTYYFDFPFADFSDAVDAVTVPEEEREGYAWLQERNITPEDLAVVGAPYKGPKIVK